MNRLWCSCSSLAWRSGGNAVRWCARSAPPQHCWSSCQRGDVQRSRLPVCVGGGGRPALPAFWSLLLSRQRMGCLTTLGVCMGQVMGGMQGDSRGRGAQRVQIAFDKQQQHLPSPILVPASLAGTHVAVAPAQPASTARILNAQRVAWSFRQDISSRQPTRSFCFFMGRAHHASSSVAHTAFLSSLPCDVEVERLFSSWPVCFVAPSVCSVCVHGTLGALACVLSFTCGPARTLQQCAPGPLITFHTPQESQKIPEPNRNLQIF